MNNLSAHAQDFIKIMHRYTGISEKRLTNYMKENGVANIVENANILCVNDSQRARLYDLFMFKYTYDLLYALGIQNIKLDSFDMTKTYFEKYFSNSYEKERFVVAYLDNQYNMITVKNMFEGTIDEAKIYPRELLKEAMFHNSWALCLAHNHIGGSPEPSNEDINTTNKLVKIFSTIDIYVVDHVIVARDQSISFTEIGLLKPNPIIVNNAIIERNKSSENEKHKTINLEARRLAKRSYDLEL